MSRRADSAQLPLPLDGPARVSMSVVTRQGVGAGRERDRDRARLAEQRSAPSDFYDDEIPF